MEQTLAILKPDCVRRGLVGLMLSRIEAGGFRIRAMRMRRLTEQQARRFYAVHEGKGFFEDLIAFMTSGPCITMILERENAIDYWREVLMEMREEHTDDLTENLCHGSDGPATSEFERHFLFADCDVC